MVLFFECFPSLLLCRSLFSFHALCHSLFFFSFKRLVADCVPFLLLSSVCLVDWCWCCSASATAPVIDYSVISSNTHTHTTVHGRDAWFDAHLLLSFFCSFSNFFGRAIISFQISKTVEMFQVKSSTCERFLWYFFLFFHSQNRDQKKAKHTFRKKKLNSLTVYAQMLNCTCSRQIFFFFFKYEWYMFGVCAFVFILCTIFFCSFSLMMILFSISAIFHERCLVFIFPRSENVQLFPHHECYRQSKIVASHVIV